MWNIFSQPKLLNPERLLGQNVFLSRISDAETTMRAWSLAVIWLLIVHVGADEDDEGGPEVGHLYTCHFCAILSIFAHLIREVLCYALFSPQHATVTCGSAIKIQHVTTGYRIHSVDFHFSLMTGMWRRSRSHVKAINAARDQVGQRLASTVCDCDECHGRPEFPLGRERRTWVALPPR